MDVFPSFYFFVFRMEDIWLDFNVPDRVFYNAVERQMTEVCLITTMSTHGLTVQKEINQHLRRGDRFTARTGPPERATDFFL